MKQITVARHFSVPNNARYIAWDFLYPNWVAYWYAERPTTIRGIWKAQPKSPLRASAHMGMIARTHPPEDLPWDKQIYEIQPDGTLVRMNTEFPEAT